jgi:hypothetical protein
MINEGRASRPSSREAAKEYSGKDKKKKPRRGERNGFDSGLWVGSASLLRSKPGDPSQEMIGFSH